MILLSNGINLSIILFILGLINIIINNNLFFILIGLEIMINSTGLSFIISGNYWGSPEGEIIYIIIITLSASETAIIMALMINLYKKYNNLNINIAREIKK